jgi:hypothetical protein
MFTRNVTEHISYYMMSQPTISTVRTANFTSVFGIQDSFNGNMCVLNLLFGVFVEMGPKLDTNVLNC